MAKQSTLWAILVGGAIAGVFDIIFNISLAAHHGGTPARLLQTIASGLFGKAAFDGGTPMAALGLGLHFAMSLIWGSIFVVAARKIALRNAPSCVVWCSV